MAAINFEACVMMYYVKHEGEEAKMSTTMVTARMDEFKKKRGNAILKKCGVTPSRAINDLYDAIIKENGLPWQKEERGIASMSVDEVADALDFLGGIQIPNSRFANMSDEEIKAERFREKALA